MLNLWSCSIVEFATQEDADSAIEKFNKTNLDGREIFLREVKLLFYY